MDEDTKNDEWRTTSTLNQWLIPLEICILELYMNEDRNEEGRKKNTHKEEPLENKWIWTN